MTRRLSTLLLTVLLIFSMAGCGGTKAAPTWQEQYDLGVRYLSEGNYEEAIIAFTAAIDIDPKQAEGYFGLSRAYAASGDVEKAAEVLAQAEELLGSSDALTAVREELGLEAAPGDVGSSGEPSVARTERVDNEDGSYRIDEYDDSGKLIRLVFYHADGSLHFDRRLTYDENDRLFSETRTYASPDSDGVSDSYAEYDQQGRTILDQANFVSGGTSIKAYTYSGPQVTVHVENPENHDPGVGTIHYTMAAADNEIMLWVWDFSDGTLIHYEIREDSPDGTVVALKAFDGNGNPDEPYR